MGKSKGSKKKAEKAATKPPKVECCVSKSKCARCPLRMLKDGTLPPPYAVKKRRLVTVDDTGRATAVKKAALKKAWAA